MSPLVWLLDVSGRAVLRILGQHKPTDDKITEDEIRSMVAEAEHAGVLEPGEKEMIAGVMRLGDAPVRAVMTPRREVDMIRLSDDPQAVRAAIMASPHSRLPAYDSDPDEVLGVIQAKDLLHAFMASDPPDIRSHVRPAPIVPDTVDARDVVNILKNSSVHIGLVVDEYGHFEGVVTSADILEAIVGEFDTEAGSPEPMVVRRDDGSLLLSGWMPAEQFQHLTGIALPEARSYHTVAGFILEAHGALPSIGESLDAYGWRFEVMDLDGRRIDKVLATKAPPARRVTPAKSRRPKS
jgi:putative hemolysin